MQYTNTLTGTFLVRKNRFTAHVAVNGQEVVCHVKNTGRLKELLYPGAAVVLVYHPDAAVLGRKTEYSLIGVYKEEAGFLKERLLVNIDSQAPNQAAAEWLSAGHFQSDITGIKREKTYGASRFDLAFLHGDRPAFMEVKGVTLEWDGAAAFPDAPTERGIKHVEELSHAVKNGYEAYLLFVIQMKGIQSFSPNRTTHPAFADALVKARAAGVSILAYDCLIQENSMVIDNPIKVVL